MELKIIEQSARLITDPEVIDKHFPQILEYAGRTCTGTESMTGQSEESTYAFLKRLMNSKHMSVFEHCSVTVELVTNRAITHQLVRHRIAAYSQQSMRYVKFTSQRGSELFGIIKPHDYDEWDDVTQSAWEIAVEHAIKGYKSLINCGLPAEQARGILPHDTATKLIATWNLRELLHIFFDSECGRLMNKHAQPQVRDIMRKLADDMMSRSKFLNWLIENA